MAKQARASYFTDWCTIGWQGIRDKSKQQERCIYEVTSYSIQELVQMYKANGLRVNEIARRLNMSTVDIEKIGGSDE